MLDKNPEMSLDNELSQIQNKLSATTQNVILFSHPFVKAEFLDKIIRTINSKIIYIDFDLLYSGYVTANIIEKNSNVVIYRLNLDNYYMNLSEIIEKISKEKHLIIIDSLNGLNNLFDEKNSARFVNASIMLLASTARVVKSYLIVATMARKREGKWILSPGGRHIFGSKNSKTYYVKEDKDKILMSELKKTNNCDQDFQTVL